MPPHAAGEGIMAGYDDEISALRAAVDCRTVLERAGWQFDKAESTRRAVKYRLGAGRIVIVTHEGRGWFDPLGNGRGDVLALAQYVWGGTPMSLTEIAAHKASGLYHAMLSSTGALVPVVPNPRKHVEQNYPIWQAQVSEAIRSYYS